jgi:hypothetical protein
MPKIGKNANAYIYIDPYIYMDQQNSALCLARKIANLYITIL